MIAICSLGCDRKAKGLHSWHELFQLEGDYSLYLNYETQMGFESHVDEVKERVKALGEDSKIPYSFDTWSWKSELGVDWRKRPQFDQDQNRLASIVCARNMCIEYAMQTEATHLLFIDADILPPRDVIAKLLAVDHPAVGGFVRGRGAHSGLQYIFGEKKRDYKNGIQVVECEHGNIGFTMLSKKLFEAVRCRWGTSHYPDGRVCMTSDDPAFHLDAFLKFGEWPLIRLDCEGKHIGPLDASEVAQF